jgi:hypothetical protein
MSESQCLQPDWNQPRPPLDEVQFMCKKISLSPVALRSDALDRFLERVRKSHHNGGAHFAAFVVGPDLVFDWFASRNRLSDEQLIDSLIVHPTIRDALPEIQIPRSKIETGLEMSDPSLLDGRLAYILYYGGAAVGDGREDKDLALAVCDAIFGLRYGELSLTESFQAWTPWFKGIAWNTTVVGFDQRFRRLSVLAITDTD